MLGSITRTEGCLSENLWAEEESRPSGVTMEVPILAAKQGDRDSSLRQSAVPRLVTQADVPVKQIILPPATEIQVSPHTALSNSTFVLILSGS